MTVEKLLRNKKTMDYKINQIKGELEATDPVLDIEGLFFATINNSYAVWDYTEYVTHNEINIDFKVLIRACKRMIENLVSIYGLDRGSLFFQDEAGRFYARSELIFVMLMFADPNLCGYFNNLLADIMSNGIALNNAMIFQLASARLPDQALQNILTNRKEDDKTDTNK